MRMIEVTITLTGLLLLASAAPALAERVRIDGLPYFRYVPATEPVLSSIAGLGLLGAALLRRARARR
jgi:hypothetical protein